MTMHQCPKCELRFDRKTELDYHCRQDHAGFRHEYPATHPPAEPPPAQAPVAHLPPPPHPTVLARFIGWALPQRPSSPRDSSVDRVYND